MNRRDFIRRLAAGVAGVAIAAHLPLDTITAFLPNESEFTGGVALEFLRRRYLAFMGHMDAHPSFIIVGRHLYAQLEAETPHIARFTKAGSPDIKHLRFKNAAVVSSAQNGWEYKIHAMEFNKRNVDLCIGDLWTVDTLGFR